MSSKNELMEVALQSFMIEGYQKTSLSKIADQLGMSKPALYYYFPNKKALFMACLDVFFNQIRSEADNYRQVGDTVKEKIFNIIKSFSSREQMVGPLADFNHYYFIFDAMKHVPEVKDMFLNASGSFTNSLVMLAQEGIEKGEIRENVDLEAFLMMNGVMLEGLTLSDYLGYFDGMDNMVDRILNVAWDGIVKA